MDRSHLCKSMNSRVGASRSLRQYIFAGQSFQAIGKGALHSWQIRLHLPSMEFGAVIGQSDFQVAAHMSSILQQQHLLFSMC